MDTVVSLNVLEELKKKIPVIWLIRSLNAQSTQLRSCRAGKFTIYICDT